MLGLGISGEVFEVAAGFYATLRPRHDQPSTGDTPGRPRNLLFYTHALTHGGAERVMAMIASAFAEQGDRVTFVVDRVMPDHGLSLSSHLKLEVLSGSHGSHLRRLRALLKSTQPDVIISALSASNMKMAAATAFAGMAGRHIMTWHGFPQAETSLLSRLGYSILPRVSRFFAQQVCVSDALLAHMRSKGIAAASSMRIYNPVDMRGLAADREQKPDGAPRLILSAGRLAPVKNFPLLLEAFSKLPEKNSRLVILGDGPERHRLEQAVNQFGLSDRVLLPGHVHDMQKWFACADVFVLPSDSESFSNVVVEALSYGLPVVSTDCGGPREILDDGRYGALVPCRDADAMTRAISVALADDGAQAVARMQRARDFDLDAAIEQYDLLFHRFAGARAAMMHRAAQ